VAPPSEGNITWANQLFEKLNLGRSLERRFAKIEECPLMWAPPNIITPEEMRRGVFDHLRSVGSIAALNRVPLPAKTMTWIKFAANVLPTAERIQILAPAVGSYMALTTATHSDAEKIIRWDNEFSWYVYRGGSRAEQWGLKPETWHTLSGITPLPNLWGASPRFQHSTGVVLLIEGMRDFRNDSLALFPEHVRQELHSVRQTIEAYSQRGKLSGIEEATACGYDIRKGNLELSTTPLLRVSAQGAESDYRIDRWD
jgi:hypothetical protein